MWMLTPAFRHSKLMAPDTAYPSRPLFMRELTVNGDVELHRVEASFLHTTVVSRGAAAAANPGDPKNVSLDLAVSEGRIEDLLRLVSRGTPGLNGSVRLHLKADRPTGRRKIREH
jgi:hypothetical protein